MLMLLSLWAFAALFLGTYIVVQRLSIPLQVQPQIFGVLGAMSWCQCLYYEHGYSKRKAISILVGFCVIFAGFEAGSVYALWVRRSWHTRRGDDLTFRLEKITAQRPQSSFTDTRAVSCSPLLFCESCPPSSDRVRWPTAQTPILGDLPPQRSRGHLAIIHGHRHSRRRIQLSLPVLQTKIGHCSIRKSHLRLIACDANWCRYHTPW